MLRRALSSSASSAAASALVRTNTAALQALMAAQGHVPCDATRRSGLHPLVVPLATTGGGDVLGLLRWPVQADALTVVRTRPQQQGITSLHSWSLQPCGSPAQYARRVAVEADAAASSANAAKDSSLIGVAAAATVEAGGDPYRSGELAASRLGLLHYLLVRVGPFTDVWESVAHGQLAKGDETAALIAAERSSSLNPGWGCSVYLQSTLMGRLGRRDEQRDLALSALEAPFWTLGSPLNEAKAAAQVSHFENLRQVVRGMEDTVRQQQNAPPRTAEELALLRALDALDEVVRTEGLWDDARPLVARSLREAGLDAAAAIADATA